MSTINKIEVSGVTYDIEDSTARSQSGLTDEAKQALLACFQNVAWISASGQTYYDALENALYPPANLVSISAVYTQSGTIYTTDSLDSLKPDLVVTAHYSDSTTETVSNYLLSGTLTAGTSTITVTYGGKTTTFNVTVSAVPEYGTFTPTNIVDGYYIDANGDIQTSSYGSYSSDYYDSYNKMYSVNFANLYDANPNWRFNEYDASKNFLRQVHIANRGGDVSGQPQVLSMLDETKYFRLSWYGEDQLRVPEVTINNAAYTDLPMEIGDIDSTTGENIEQPKRLRSAEYIPVSGSSLTVTNCLPFLAGAGIGSGSGYFFRCYDSSKNLVGSLAWTTSDATFTLPTNTAYVRPVFQFGSSNIPSNFDEYVFLAFIMNSVNYRITKV